jgi:hypothetical protein
MRRNGVVREGGRSLTRSTAAERQSIAAEAKSTGPLSDGRISNIRAAMPRASELIGSADEAMAG